MTFLDDLLGGEQVARIRAAQQQQHQPTGPWSQEDIAREAARQAARQQQPAQWARYTPITQGTTEPPPPRKKVSSIDVTEREKRKQAKS